MTLCLDTNVFIDVLNGQGPAVRRRYEDAVLANRPLVASSLTAHELVYGALTRRRPDYHVTQVRQLLAQVEIIDWTEGDAYAAARVRARLREAGQVIGHFDGLIAGQALNQGWTLVTANTREFSRVEGLPLEDWSASKL